MCLEDMLSMLRLYNYNNGLIYVNVDGVLRAAKSAHVTTDGRTIIEIEEGEL